MIKGCGICQEKWSKYKCPKCYIPFCSVNCGKTHKNSPSCTPTTTHISENNQDNAVKQQWVTDDTVPTESLAKLNESSKLKELLENRNLRDVLFALDKSSNPEPLLIEAMKDPDFEEFVKTCLDVVEPEENLRR